MDRIKARRTIECARYALSLLQVATLMEPEQRDTLVKAISDAIELADKAIPEPASQIRFSHFEFCIYTGELKIADNGHSRKIHLPGQQAIVLSSLLDRPGELIKREELCKKLWPNNLFMDTEQGLNAVVKRLRRTLKDDSDEPRFIETIPRRGYRFIARIGE